jgi:Bacterial Ig domain
MLKRFFIVGLAIAAIALAAQTSGPNPTLGKLVEGSQLVSGVASTGSAPIDIYDISFPARTKLGTATAVAGDGSFSSSIKPPLVKDHQIIAVDKNGNTSAAVTVQARPDSAPFPQ